MIALLRRWVKHLRGRKSKSFDVVAAGRYELKVPGKYQCIQPRRRPHSVNFEYELPDRTYIQVFWSVQSAEVTAEEAVLGAIGPAICFFAHDWEVIRFDCLGEKAHYHVALPRPIHNSEWRLWMPEQTREAQVERAIFELDHNLNYYLQRNPRPEIREMGLCADEHRTRCLAARAKAYEFLARFSDQLPAAERVVPGRV